MTDDTKPEPEPRDRVAAQIDLALRTAPRAGMGTEGAA